MGPQLLVESRIADGQKLINQLVRDGFPVTVAFWVKASGEGFWRLYIASPSAQTEKIGETYRVVYASLRKLINPLVELSEIKLIPAIDPIAQDAISARDHYYAGKSPTKYDGERLGNLAIDEAYIYPPPGKWFKGFDEIKQEFPSAEAFVIPVLNEDMTFSTVAPYMSQLNAGVFEGKPPGTVMFVGPEGSSAKPIGELVFVYRPEGWNTLFRPETQKWEEVRFVATGEPPYRSVDFTPLAALRTDRKPCDDNIDHMKKLLAKGFYLTIPPDTRPIYSIPFTFPPEPGKEPRPPLDWEDLRKIMELGGTIEVHQPAIVGKIETSS